MKRIMVHNTTNCPIYVGASMIPAGESRDFPEDQVPAHLRPKEEPAPASEPEKADHLAELAAKPVRDIQEHFSALTNEELERLAKLEEERKVDGKPAPRKTLLEAIGAELLQRAQGVDQQPEGGQA